jgi:hypothetical protein
MHDPNSNNAEEDKERCEETSDQHYAATDESLKSSAKFIFAIHVAQPLDEI